jgi:acyl carrier protein
MNNSDPLSAWSSIFQSAAGDVSFADYSTSYRGVGLTGMVQLIADFAGYLHNQVRSEWIEMLRSYEEISCALSRKDVLPPRNNSLASVNRVTREQIREFLRSEICIRELGLDPAAVTDDFDFLLREVVDSFGILGMIISIEDEFHIQLDMASLDAEQISILGLLSRYVAEHGRANNLSASG